MPTPPHLHSVAQSASKMTLSAQSQQHTEANPVQPQQQQLSYPHSHPRQSQHSSQQELQQPILQNHRKGSSGSNHSHVRACKTEGHNVSATVCANCGTTTTPLWRRAPTGETICNACGLYLKARNTVRPPWLKRNTIKKASPATPESPDSTNGTCPGDGHCDGTGGSSSCHGCPAYNQHQVNRQALICANCGTNTTPLWRRDEAGNTICNACGLYFKLHNVHRPVTMKRSVIKRRKRVTLATSPPPTSHHHQRHHSGNSDNEHPRKNRIQHPPTPASSSGSEHGYFSSEDEVCSNDSYTSTIGQKRKHVINLSANKRQCGNNRTVPAIEDYIAINHHGDNVYHTADERRRSLTPVEPTLNPQVQIHNNNNGLSSGRIMGTPSIPLISVYPKNKKETSFQSGHESSTNYAMSSSPISALLNPTSPTTAAPQLPPINSIPPPPNHYPAPLPTASMADPNITQQLLQAHRQELQREVSHLSMLLNRTTAILVGLDQAMNANDSPQPNGPLPSMSLASDANSTSALASLFALPKNNGTHYAAHHQQQGGSTSGTSVQQPYMTLPPPSSLAGLRSQSVSSDRV